MLGIVYLYISMQHPQNSCNGNIYHFRETEPIAISIHTANNGLHFLYNLQCLSKPIDRQVLVLSYTTTTAEQYASQLTFWNAFAWWSQLLCTAFYQDLFVCTEEKTYTHIHTHEQVQMMSRKILKNINLSHTNHNQLVFNNRPATNCYFNVSSSLSLIALFARF